MPESANEHLAQLKSLLAATPPSKILDVGVGRGNYGWFLRNEVRFTGTLHGVEVWAPYVENLMGGNKSYYNEIKIADIRDCEAYVTDLKPDVVFAFDVLEHLPHDDAVRVLRFLQRAAKQSVLVSLPIVPYPQGPIHGNVHETHLYDWTTEEMISLGSELIHKGGVTGLFRFPGSGSKLRMSVVLNTVRGDEAFGGRSVLKSIADDLATQSVKDFEFIAVDGLHPHRHETFYEHGYPFRIMHVPPKDCAMVREKRCAISAYKNTGFAHARGELVLTIDDGCRLDPEFLSRCWKAWEERRGLLSALYVGVDANGAPIPDKGARDSRSVYLDADGRCLGGGNPSTPPMHGFTAIPIQAIICVNGYDEMFDGSRGLEDIEMGIRLQKAGYKIMLDRAHTIELYPQGPWSEKVFGTNRLEHGILAQGERVESLAVDSTNIKCCQTTLQIQLGLGRPKANAQPWSAAEWGKVTPRCFLLTNENRCSLNQHKCPHVGSCSDREHPGLAALKNEPPIFDMANLRYANGII